MKKLLITGGCGFVGINLIDFLLEKTDWSFTVLDNLSSGKKEYLKAFDSSRIDFIKGDICEINDVILAVDNCDYVVNLAAQAGVIPSIDDPIFDANINIIGLLNVLNASKKHGIKRFVHASSAAPLGDQNPPINENKVPKPLSPYGASKLAGEGYLSAFAGSYNLKTIGLRFSNVYGPYSYQKGSVIAMFIKQMIKNERVTIFGDGNQTRDFIHACDISNAIFLALTRDFQNKFELFQIATGTETSVNMLYDIIKKHLEYFDYSPKPPIYAEKRAGEIIRNYADISKVKKILGYEPKISLQQGIVETIEWFIENKQDL